MDQRLIERAKDGDLDAYDDLMDRYQSLAFRAAYLTLGDADEAEDAVQEAFVKAYLNLGRFNASAPFRPWLLRIVTNEALNRHRSSRRHANLRIRSSEGGVEQHSAELPEDLVEAAETRRALVECINRIPARDRALIVYRYFLDLSPSEIAEIWDSPSSTIRTQISRALQKLRDELDGDQDMSFPKSSEVGKDAS